MRLPLQITFRNMKASDLVEGWIQEEALKLDSFYKRIMSCRVVVEVPHSHHKKGNPYHIRIDLTLPGREIVIKRQPSLENRSRRAGERGTKKSLEVDVPHKVLRTAIDDAFKIAGRRLQDYARRQRGDVKSREPLPGGQVVRIFLDEGYGFLATRDGREIYFNEHSVLNRPFKKLKVGTPVAFVEEQGEEGPQASTVRIVRTMAASA